MHQTAVENARRFFNTYGSRRHALTIIDVGAQDVNGSLREVAPSDCRYVGLDFVAGKGVDVLITDPYALPLVADSADIVVCSSCFEHSEFFWLLFNEVMRVLKPNGLFYLNVPSNGDFHRYPVDCWRFYPDSGIALQNWGRRSGFPTALLESFTAGQGPEAWSDFVAVFLKDEKFSVLYPARIQDRFKDYRNGWVQGAKEFSQPARLTEDHEWHPIRSIRHLSGRGMQNFFEIVLPTIRRRLNACLRAIGWH